MILYLVNRMSTGLLIGTPRDPGEIFIPLLGGYIFDKRCSGVFVDGFVFLFFLYLSQLCTVNGTSFNLRISTEFWSSLTVEFKIGGLKSEELSSNLELITTRVDVLLLSVTLF